MPRLEVATPAPDNTFVDINEEPEVWAVSNPGHMLLRTAGIQQGTPATLNGTILQSTAGTINTTTALGRQWRGAITQAVVGLRGGQFAPDVTLCGWWPLGLDWTGFPASARLVRLRYQFSVNLWRVTIPVLGDGRFGVGLNFTIAAGTLVSEDANTAVGIEISSKPSVNGGNWTCIWRTASLGALGSFDTGVAVGGVGPPIQRLGFYYDTDINQVTFLVNDVPVYILVSADVPQPTGIAGVPVQRLGVFQFGSGVANQQDRWADARMQISRL